MPEGSGTDVVVRAGAEGSVVVVVPVDEVEEAVSVGGVEEAVSVGCSSPSPVPDFWSCINHFSIGRV